MLTFLLIATVLLLLLSVLSYWQIFKMSAREFFEDWTESDMGNVGLQLFYGLTGLYVFYVLTVMNYVRPTFLYGILTILDALLFVAVMYRYQKNGTVLGYYRSGIGLYVSGLLQLLFLAVTLFYLIPEFL